MFMGYIYLECSECGKCIRHHSKDALTRTTRICPSCGSVIQVSVPQSEDLQTPALD